MNTLEEKIAHLERVTDEMSDVIARQDTEIALLTRKVELLLEAEAGRQKSDGGGHIFGGDERPPHY